MAIFNRRDDKAGSGSDSTNSSTTIIMEGSFIKGEMTLSCDLYVDGKFEGNINSHKSVTVGKNGQINGEIHAAQLIVQGVVEGYVDADRIEIKKAGRVNGFLLTSELLVKGLFEGERKTKEKRKSAV